MLYAVMFLCAFTVIETVKCSHKISCDTAYPVKRYIVGMLLPAAAWTSFTDYTLSLIHI